MPRPLPLGRVCPDKDTCSAVAGVVPWAAGAAKTARVALLRRLCLVLLLPRPLCSAHSDLKLVYCPLRLLTRRCFPLRFFAFSLISAVGQTDVPRDVAHRAQNHGPVRPRAHASVADSCVLLLQRALWHCFYAALLSSLVFSSLHANVCEDIIACLSFRPGSLVLVHTYLPAPLIAF